AEDGIRFFHVTGVQTCALPISPSRRRSNAVSSPCPRSARSSRSRRLWRPSGPTVFSSSATRPHRSPTRSPRFQRHGKGRSLYSRSEERRVGKEWRARGGGRAVV